MTIAEADPAVGRGPGGIGARALTGEFEGNGYLKHKGG